ncbi:dienelactone hydrolase family protein [Novosphingobium ginsenosidimutans]|uniref:Dienelactone hydrolase family protein n=1 Tax=Novosphingobium ginsenosidimutans TaxID=1176536 RepID=A0A5B8S3S5_9SPHN|nr:dienelactone hydrolase family protein [Novosphingobium ginsenosidimutans]QEA16196.1 dienelactone hydrolase family protein [Novosphingobium ginsenosidimutans]
MCDDLTAIEEQQALDARGIDRRSFAALGVAGLGVLAAPLAAKAPAGLAEQMVTVTTPDGKLDAFFVHPAKGRHPAVILWPDIAGLREAYKVMARRLAADGHAVLVLNQYYRSAPAPHFDAITQWRTSEGQAKLRPMIPLLTPEAIERDAKAAVAWLDGQKAVDKKRGIGSSGYCMGGPFTVRTAHAVPGRVRAAASFHGGSLVTDKPDSPHQLLKATKAGYLFAIARNDDARSPGDKDALRDAAKAAGRPAEVEVYPADHGWCTIDSPVFDKVQADRAWERMLALFRTL